jgi:hypothetical protein
VVAAQMGQQHVLRDRLTQFLIAIIQRDPQPIGRPVGERLMDRQAVEDQGIADRVVRRDPLTFELLGVDGQAAGP